RGVPLAALAASAAGMLIAIVLALKGQQGFLLLYGTAVAAMFFVWTTILVTHIRFRQALSTERVRLLPVMMPGGTLPSMFGIVVILALAASTVFVEGLEWAVPVFLTALILMTVFFFLRK